MSHWLGIYASQHLLNGTTISSFSGCLDPRHCHRRRPFPLQMPENILHLPVQLHDFSWKLLVPENSLSLALAPVQKLQQNTYERPCNTSFSYLVASAIPGQNQHLGTFCSGGSIERIQVKQNISVTLRTFGPNFQQEASKQTLSVSYIPYLKGKGFWCIPLRFGDLVVSSKKRDRVDTFEILLLSASARFPRKNLVCKTPEVRNYLCRGLER